MRKIHLRKRTLAIAAAVVMLLGVVGLGVAGNFLFEFALDPHAGYSMKQMMDADEVDGLEEAPANDAALEQQAAAWFEEGRVQVTHTAEDGTALSGWRIDQPEAAASHTYAVVLHGYTAEPARVAKYAYSFYERGMNVLMPAARAHERSGGAFIGMGWPERRDVIGWLDDIVAADPDARILVFGISMGGATAMMTAGESDLPANVVGIIEDCGYASVWEEFAVQLQNVFGLPSFPLLDVANAVCQVRAGWDFHEASAVDAVSRATVPMLFIHGDADTFVPYEMLDEVYEACASPVKEKLVVHGAPHAGSASTNPEQYWTCVNGFLDKIGL